MLFEKHTIGPHTMYRGDCLEILPTIEAGSVDVIISDPPYGDDETHEKHLSSITLKNGEPARQVLGFGGISETECVDMTKIWCATAKRWVVFTCEWKFISAIEKAGLLIRFGIWRKPDGAPQFTGDRPGTGWEGIAICHKQGKKRWNGGGKHAFYTFPKGQNKSGHPTGKPLGLFRAFVEDFSEEDETVLDPFMGSGTTGVACIQTGRKFIGIELEPKYFDIACKRMEEAYGKGSLFEEVPASQQMSLFAESATE